MLPKFGQKKAMTHLIDSSLPSPINYLPRHALSSCWDIRSLIYLPLAGGFYRKKVLIRCMCILQVRAIWKYGLDLKFCCPKKKLEGKCPRSKKLLHRKSLHMQLGRGSAKSRKRKLESIFHVNNLSEGINITSNFTKLFVFRRVLSDWNLRGQWLCYVRAGFTTPMIRVQASVPATFSCGLQVCKEIEMVISYELHVREHL